MRTEAALAPCEAPLNVLVNVPGIAGSAHMPCWPTGPERTRVRRLQDGDLGCDPQVAACGLRRAVRRQEVWLAAARLQLRDAQAIATGCKPAELRSSQVRVLLSPPGLRWPLPLMEASMPSATEFCDTQETGAAARRRAHPVTFRGGSRLYIKMYGGM